MAFVIVGCLLLAMKLLEVGFASTWSWWVILLPFACAVAWWSFSDAVGLTRKREMDKLDERKEERRRRQMDALGLNWRRSKRVAVIRETRKVEPPPMAAPKKTTEEERHNRDVITAFLPSRQELPPSHKSTEKAG